jgi:chaperonin GroEL
MKKILFGNDARQQIKNGIDKVCDVVKVSLGAQGKNVLIYTGTHTEVINDGVSIAEAVDVKDETEMAGIQLAKQCANKTDEDAGDGTTTTLVLLQFILNEIIQPIQTEDPRIVRDRLFKEAQEVLDKVDVKQIETKEDIYNLANTASLDSNIATIVSDIYNELGKDAQVSVEETYRTVLEKEILNGIKFESKKADRFSEDKQIIEDCDVMVLDKVETIDDLQEGVKRAVTKGNKYLLAIANSFSHSSLVSIMGLRDFNIVPVEYKMFAAIEDLRDYAGETVKKVIIEPSFTTIIGGSGNATEKIEKLKEKLAKEESAYERENIEKRIAQLGGKITVIRVGKDTDVARHEAVLKIEDALGTIKGAYETGYCKGGGMALREAVTHATPKKGLAVSQSMWNICESPYQQICANAGGEIEIPDTVIDSFKTVKHSLLNALSTATSVLMVEAALIKENDDSA